jgi:hypothetical protein
MSEELYVAFRTYITEGLLGVGDKEALQIIDSKGYDFERRKEVIKAYRDVTRDEILGPMIPELSSYDLNNEGTDIKTLYGVRKREKELTQQTSKPLQVENAVQDPVSESKEPVQTNQEFVDDIKKIQDKIAETQKIMVQEPTLEPSVLIPQQGLDDTKKTNANKKELKLNNVGYANVVLMSIIVIIIMAIIGVFIFVN